MYLDDELGSGNEMMDALVNSKALFSGTPRGKEPDKSIQLLVQKRDLPSRELNTPQMESQVIDMVSGQSQLDLACQPACPKCRKDFNNLADLQSHRENRECLLLSFVAVEDTQLRLQDCVADVGVVKDRSKT